MAHMIWGILMNSVKDAISPATNDPILKQAQYCGWAPVGHNLACVSNHKNIYVTQDLGNLWALMTFKSEYVTGIT